MLDHQGSTELAEAVGRVAESIEDSLSVFDAEADPFIAGGVGDEKKRGGVHVASVGEA